ncbi:Phox homology [Dillenia turbinata]|uniref:Phox homology n=1 Tax=Dillenia turbinata TaxID=194707 RepID=A0AAN8YU23_9MAGN
MQRPSPRNHRHDGTSPLPLGMDWSPPPRKWSGRNTVWPHDPHTGWSYCVTIPCWVVLPRSRDSDPVVFYRVQVGVQSPEGITTIHGILRRFNDFWKLYNDLKKAFPRKSLPPAPPKGLLRIKSKTLLEERRGSLEDWMTKLLSDIDLSRSIAVASFLELEAAARSSFQDVHQNGSETNPSTSASTSSVASDYGSDTAYETSELGTPRLGRDNSSEAGAEELNFDDELANPLERLVKYGISNIDEGLFMGDTILQQLESLPRNMGHSKMVNSAPGKVTDNGNTLKATIPDGCRVDNHLFELEHGKAIHARKLSNESVGSDVSSVRGSELSNSGILNLKADGSPDPSGDTELIRSTGLLADAESQFSNDLQIVLPLDQRQKMNRVLMTMQRRLVTAKTDMEDLIARLNQEMAVKDYLTTKVKDLEGELENTKQKGKENLQQALLVERERVTQMQWDMEELRHKLLEAETKLKSKQGMSLQEDPRDVSTIQNGEIQPQELNSTKEQLENLMKQHQELEVKSKADMKVLRREVKALRSSQTQLKQELSRSLKERSEAEKLLQHEKEMNKHALICRRKLLDDCEILRDKLRECSIDFLAEDEDKLIKGYSSLSDAMHLLAMSDNRINQLLTEVQVLAQEDINPGPDKNHDMNNETRTTDIELRKMLGDILTDNATLRRKVNSVFRCALKMDNNSDKDVNNTCAENSLVSDKLLDE